MFASRFFPDRYYAPRYWDKTGAGTAPVVVTQGGHNGKSRRHRREKRWATDREIDTRRQHYDAPQRIAAKDRPAVEIATPAPTMRAVPAAAPQATDAIDQAALARFGAMGGRVDEPVPAGPAPISIEALILLMEMA